MYTLVTGGGAGALITLITGADTGGGAVAAGVVGATAGAGGGAVVGEVAGGAALAVAAGEAVGDAEVDDVGDAEVEDAGLLAAAPWDGAVRPLGLRRSTAGGGGAGGDMAGFDTVGLDAAGVAFMETEGGEERNVDGVGALDLTLAAGGGDARPPTDFASATVWTGAKVIAAATSAATAGCTSAFDARCGASICGGCVTRAIAPRVCMGWSSSAELA